MALDLLVDALLGRLGVEHLLEAVDLLVLAFDGLRGPHTLPDNDLRLVAIDYRVIHDLNANWVAHLVGYCWSDPGYDINRHILFLSCGSIFFSSGIVRGPTSDVKVQFTRALLLFLAPHHLVLLHGGLVFQM